VARASVISPYQAFWDGDTPLSGGSLTFYQNETTTLAAIWRDPELKIPQVNPYRLDAGGRINGDIRFPSTLSVKIEDAYGNEIDTLDGVTCFDDGVVFGEWNAFTVYGEGGDNIVTGSDGNYYVSLVDDNLANDPVSSPTEWELIYFLQGSFTQSQRIGEIGAINPTTQQLIIGTGTGWTSTTVAQVTPNFIGGLNTSNGTDADHDIDITAGRCTDSTNTWSMVLGAFTKRIDATWEAGTGNGGLADGATLGNNTWYHLFVVQIGTTVDAMFDTSPVCANGVANNDVAYFRRIASVLTNASANIRAYRQSRDYFVWPTMVADVSAVAPPGDTAVLAALTVPLGFETSAICYSVIVAPTSSADCYLIVSNPEQPDQAPGAAAYQQVVLAQSGSGQAFSSTFITKTNTSSQIRYHFEGAASLIEFSLKTVGYIDMRGK
jgi:hypothetical protein